MPDVPTVAEAGYPDFDLASWWGMLAPAGVSRDIIARLHSETVKILNLPNVRKRLSGEGADGLSNTPEQFAAYIKSEIVKWGKLGKASGARID